MSFDWDALVLAPVMGIFGEGIPANETTLPLYTPRDLPAFRVADAVFDEQYEVIDVNPNDGSTSTTHLPVLGVRVGLFPRRPAQNDVVFIPSAAKSYVVRDVQPDGHGHAKLMLMERAS